MSTEIDSIGLDNEVLFDRASPDQISSVWNGRQVSWLEGNLAKCRIGGINGINTIFQEAVSHAEYISRFARNQPVNWVYNRTHGFLLDGLETILLNYVGYSPNTAAQLRGNWNAFHEENKDVPDLKYLQFCHSQGAAHVRNGLLHAPREVQARILVVSIAPSVIIPGEICFKSFNYASEKDLVPYVELARWSAFDTNEFGLSKLVEIAIEQREQLIRLPAHAGAKGLDHDFQSPTYARIIKDHIDDYIAREGIYQG
jgi:hypothetical protein